MQATASHPHAHANAALPGAGLAPTLRALAAALATLVGVHRH